MMASMITNDDDDDDDGSDGDDDMLELNSFLCSGTSARSYCFVNYKM